MFWIFLKKIIFFFKINNILFFLIYVVLFAIERSNWKGILEGFVFWWLIIWILIKKILLKILLKGIMV